MYKAAIFDLDGTLADTLESMACAGNATIEALGYKARNIEEYRYFAGDGAAELVRRFMKAAGDENNVNFDKAYKIYQGFFEKDCTYKVKMYDGIKEMLDSLKNAGLKVAVLSNKPHERAIAVVEELFGKNYFDIIFGQQNGIRRKPDPEGAFIISDKLGIEPANTGYIGDTNVDMITGKRAGMFTIGVLWGFRDRKELEENSADAIAEKPKDIISLLVEK